MSRNVLIPRPGFLLLSQETAIHYRVLLLGADTHGLKTGDIVALVGDPIRISVDEDGSWIYAAHDQMVAAIISPPRARAFDPYEEALEDGPPRESDR